MKYLGVDYGEKRIGIAVSDEYGIIARAAQTLKVNSLAEAVSKVQRLARSHAVKRIVVGLPLGPNREETQQSIQTRYFANALKNTNGFDVEFWNEAFTTIQASLKVVGKSKKKKLATIDSEAARILLQEYLDFRQSPLKSDSNISGVADLLLKA